MIIGIIGRKGAGKDTVASMIQENAYLRNVKTERKQIAFKLKKACSGLLGKNLEEFEDNSIKNLRYNRPLLIDCDSVLSFLGHFGISPKESASIYEYLKDSNFSHYVNSHRELMQFMGTNILRTLVGEGAHINSVSSSLYDDNTLYLITDVRFENEALSLKKLSKNVILLGIYRDGAEKDDHPSEAGMEDLISRYADITIANNGSLGDLQSKVSSIVRKIF